MAKARLSGFPIETISSVDCRRLSLRCPECRRESTLDSIGTDWRIYTGSEWVHVGHRKCPTLSCLTHLFVAYDPDGSEVICFPQERVDFDATDVPEKVVAPFEEAIACHAEYCHVAAAIMVRKTLEMICEDRGATGKNLNERIDSLAKITSVSGDMIGAIHDLRLLGNDAAHVESRVFDDVGEEEVSIAIDIAKEILKATYQQKAILSRLSALKAATEVPKSSLT